MFPPDSTVKKKHEATDSKTRNPENAVFTQENNVKCILIHPRKAITVEHVCISV